MNATHAVDLQEIQTTRGEKALAFVLAAFLLIGLVWGYTKLDVRDPSAAPPPLSAEDQAAIDAHYAAQQRLFAAEDAEAAALADLELKRERYRTALDAGQLADALAAQYRQADRTLSDAQRRVASARAEVRRLAPAADAASEGRYQAFEAQQRREERLTFLYRLVFALLTLGAAFGLLRVLRGSRWFTLGIAAVGAATILALGFTVDYVEDHVEWRDSGPIMIAGAGIGLTLVSFWGLQRYLQRRIPLRRVRKGECPFCGFPAAGNSSCEGCGRAVAGSCSHCGERRRVGVLHCGSCGKA